MGGGPVTTFLWVVVAIAGPALGVLWAVQRRGRLDCGCAPGGAVYGCIVCDHTRCTEHRYDVHDCNERLTTGG